MKVFLCSLFILSSVNNLMAAETLDRRAIKAMYRLECYCKYIDLGRDWDCIPTVDHGRNCYRGCRRIYRHFRDQNLGHTSRMMVCRMSQMYSQRNISPWKEFYETIPE